jgi:hypothetical protein
MLVRPDQSSYPEALRLSDEEVDEIITEVQDKFSGLANWILQGIINYVVERTFYPKK